MTKSRKLLSLFLSFALAASLSLVALASTANADSADGIQLSKTITTNDQGEYEITLEAYLEDDADVPTTSTTEAAPCDIVLVIDQSSTMAYSFDNITYEDVSAKTNNKLSTYADEGSLVVIEDGSNDYLDVTITLVDETYTYTWEGQTQEFASDGKTTRPNFDGVTFYYRTITESTRTDALQDAAELFLDNVYVDALGDDGRARTDDDLSHRIAIVGFANDNYTTVATSYSYENTELYISAATYNYASLTPELYAQAFQDMTTTDGYTRAYRSILFLEAFGETAIHLGLEMAANIFEYNPVDDDEERQRIVVVLTDGSPYTGSGDTFADANLALTEALGMKEDSDVDAIYTIGIFTDADATTTLPELLTTWDTSQSNRFMHLLSSEYPDTTSMSSSGERYTTSSGSTPSYYFSASDPDALTAIFNDISEDVGELEVESGADLFIRDIIATGYDLPEGCTTNDIEVSTQAYLGEDKGWDDPVSYCDATVTIDGKTIDVSGFDFDSEAVGEDSSGNAYGSKIVITIPVECTATFGGTGYTNDAESGIYTDPDEELVKTFEQPTCSETLDYQIDASKDTIYLGQTTDIADNLLWTEGYQPDGTNNAFVDIVYTLESHGKTYTCTIPAQTDTTAKNFSLAWQDESGNTMPTIEALPLQSGINAYNLSCTVSDTWEGDNPLDDLELQDQVEAEAIPCTLVLSKEVTGDSYEATDSFLISLTQDSSTVDYYNDLAPSYSESTTFLLDEMSIALKDGESVTITGLPVGSYTLIENQDWSWRYSFVSATGGTAIDYGTSVTLPEEGATAQSGVVSETSVVISNKLATLFWLSDEVSATNSFDVTDGAVTVTTQD